MNKEEYYKRLEKTTEKIKTDRCSEDDIANINRQKLYLAEHYISNLEQENQKYKEVINKAIDFIKNNGEKQYNHHDNYRGKWYSPDELDTLEDILKEVE